jgi:hypothetical protein
VCVCVSLSLSMFVCLCLYIELSAFRTKQGNLLQDCSKAILYHSDTYEQERGKKKLWECFERTKGTHSFNVSGLRHRSEKGLPFGMGLHKGKKNTHSRPTNTCYCFPIILLLLLLLQFQWLLKGLYRLSLSQTTLGHCMISRTNNI